MKENNEIEVILTRSDLFEINRLTALNLDELELEINSKEVTYDIDSIKELCKKQVENKNLLLMLQEYDCLLI